MMLFVPLNGAGANIRSRTDANCHPRAFTNMIMRRWCAQVRYCIHAGATLRNGIRAAGALPAWWEPGTHARPAVILEILRNH